jgi:hypothetical protein
MSELEHFKIIQDYTVFHPVGQVSIEHAVQLVKSAIIKTRESHFYKLLADISGLTGFDPPSLSARYFLILINEWAQAAGGVVQVAVVVRKELIDREKFGVIVASNVGLIANVFVSEDEALAWLKSH